MSRLAGEPVIRLLSRHCSRVMGPESHHLLSLVNGPMGTGRTRATGARRAGPVRRAGLRQHHRRPDRRTGRADEEHLLPSFPRQTRSVGCRAGHALPALRRGNCGGTAVSDTAGGRRRGPDARAKAFTPERRDLGRKMQAAIAASSELQERDTLKRVGLATAITDALKNEECQTRPRAWLPKSESWP